VVSLNPGCAVDHAGLGNVFFSGAEPFQISILFQQNASQLKPRNSTLSINNRQGLNLPFLPDGNEDHFGAKRELTLEFEYAIVFSSY
jgi:hypothetical protein